MWISRGADSSRTSYSPEGFSAPDFYNWWFIEKKMKKKKEKKRARRVDEALGRDTRGIRKREKDSRGPGGPLGARVSRFLRLLAPRLLFGPDRNSAKCID